MSRYLRTDEQHDVLVSLREVRNQFQRIDHDRNCWKWAIIALASAVNGALTCNLTGTMQVGALEMKCASKTIAALQKDSHEEMPQQRLASPAELLRRSKVSERIEAAGPRLEVLPLQEASFNRLFEFRDEFLHFKPSSVSIEISRLPSIVHNVMQIIKATIDDEWSFRHLDAPLQAELRELCDRIIQELERLGRF